VAINKGGTGETTAQAALDALAAASGSLVQGDIFIVDSSGNVVRLARGSDNQTLVMNGSNPNWETVSAGGATITAQEISPPAQTTTATTLTDMTSGSITLANETDGKAFCNFVCNIEMADASNQFFIAFELDSVSKNSIANHGPANNLTTISSLSQIFDTDGETLQLQWYVAGSTATLANSSVKMSRCTILEIA